MSVTIPRHSETVLPNLLPKLLPNCCILAVLNLLLTPRMTAIELRQMRTAARMSQAELADAANVPRIYIASIERGADFIPQIEAALRSALVQRQREMQEALL